MLESISIGTAVQKSVQLHDRAQTCIQCQWSPDAESEHATDKGETDTGGGGAHAGVESGGYDPCIDNQVVVYLNRKEVQEALHVPLPARPAPVYEVCSSQLVYNRCAQPLRPSSALRWT